MKHLANRKEKSMAIQHTHLLDLRTAEGMWWQHNDMTPWSREKPFTRALCQTLRKET